MTVVITTTHPAITVTIPAPTLSKNPTVKEPSAIAKPTTKDTITPVSHATKFNKFITLFIFLPPFLNKYILLYLKSFVTSVLLHLYRGEKENCAKPA